LPLIVPIEQALRDLLGLGFCRRLSNLLLGRHAIQPLFSVSWRSHLCPVNCFLSKTGQTVNKFIPYHLRGRKFASHVWGRISSPYPFEEWL